MFHVEKQSVLVPGSGFMAQKPHLETRSEGHQGGRKLVGVHLPVPLTLRRRDTLEDSDSRCVTVNIFITIIFIVVQVGALPKNLDQWKSLTFSRFVPNIVKEFDHQLRYHPLLFHNFIWFNIKATVGHHPFIQKEVVLCKIVGCIICFMLICFILSIVYITSRDNYIFRI